MLLKYMALCMMCERGMQYSRIELQVDPYLQSPQRLGITKYRCVTGCATGFVYAITLVEQCTTTVC